MTHILTARIPALWVAALLGVHAALALAIAELPWLATCHALAALAAGLWLAFAGRQPKRAIYAAAYITGAEVLWRMAGAEVFWEFGKYAVVLLLLALLFRETPVRAHAAAWLYLACLLPSSLLTLAGGEWSEVRRQLSFNLSGPLALAVCCWCFRGRVFSGTQIHGLLLALAAPAAGIAALAVRSLLTAREIRFTTESSFLASGGFGPNQVSSVLGLAAFAMFFLAAAAPARLACRLLFIALAGGFAVLSALTFSRSGLYLAAAACLTAGFFLLQDRLRRPRLLAASAALAALLAYAALPRLDAYTSGALAERFSDLSLTHRGELLQADLALWTAHPFFGVGPGRSSFERETTVGYAAAHTEFSRLAAEHGLLGLVAMALLLYMALEGFLAAERGYSRALTGALIVWSFLFMAGNAMRLAAPALLFGFTQARLLGAALPARRSGHAGRPAFLARP